MNFDRIPIFHDRHIFSLTSGFESEETQLERYTSLIKKQQLPSELRRSTLTLNYELFLIPQATWLFTNVENLTLQFRKLQSKEQFGLLKRLDFQIPFDFPMLRVLTTLTIKDIQFLNFPDNFDKMPALTYLRVENCYIHDAFGWKIPPCLKTLALLHVKSAATFSTEWIKQLTNIEELIFNDCDVKELPIEISKLSKLQVLELNNVLIKSLPSSIGGLKSLRILKIKTTQIHEIPNELCNLESLTTLNLIQCDLNYLPEKLNGLTQLLDLNISINPLKILSKSIIGPVTLKNLDLCNTDLVSVPIFVKSCNNLESLWLSKSLITNFSTLASVPSLLFLALQGLNLLSVPDAIRFLVNLKTLTMDENRISELPEFLIDLRSLETLSLNGNNFNSLPLVISQIPQLKYLRMGSNRLSGEAKLFAERKDDALLFYCKQLYSSDSLPQQSCNLIVLGRGQAGKTTLLKSINASVIKANEESKLNSDLSEELIDSPERTKLPSFSQLGTKLMKNLSVDRSDLNLQLPIHKCNLEIQHPSDGRIKKELTCGKCQTLFDNISVTHWTCHCDQQFSLCKQCGIKTFTDKRDSGSDVILWHFTDLPGQAEFFATYSHFISIPYAIILIVCSLERAIYKTSNGSLSINVKVLEEDCRLWCSMVNQLAKSGKRVATAKSFLVLTHFDFIENEEVPYLAEKLSWEGGSVTQKNKFNEWWIQLCNHLPTAYPHANIDHTKILCLNARKILEVKNRLWDNILVPAGKELLKNQRTPKYFVLLKRQFQKFQETIFPIQQKNQDINTNEILSIDRYTPPYMARSNALALFSKPPFSLSSIDQIVETMSILMTLGEIIYLDDDQTIVLSPLWLSNVISAVVMPSLDPFNGLKMNNGTVLYTLLKSYLLNPSCHDSGVLFSNETQVDDTLDILSGLDIIIQSKDMKEHLHHILVRNQGRRAALHNLQLMKDELSASNSGQSIVQEHSLSHQTIFVPSRMDNDRLEFNLPAQSLVYGRRLLYRNDNHARFPPATIPLMICWLGAFSRNSNWKSDCSRNFVRLRLGEDSNAYICIDKWHRWLDIIISALPSDLHIVGHEGPKLVEAVKWILAFLGYQNQEILIKQKLNGSNGSNETNSENPCLDLELLDNYIHEERLCGTCILEVRQSKIDHSNICVIPPSTGLYQYEDENNHTETMESLEFPQVTEAVVPSSLSINIYHWTSVELINWIIQREPLLDHFFKNSNGIWNMETIFKLNKPWHEVDRILKEEYGCTSRSLRLKLIETFTYIQKNAPPQPQNDSPYPSGLHPLPPLTFESNINHCSFMLREKIYHFLIDVPTNMMNWKRLAGEFKCSPTEIDVFSLTPNPFDCLVRKLGSNNITVQQLKDKLCKLKRYDVVALIDEEVVEEVVNN